MTAVAELNRDPNSSPATSSSVSTGQGGSPALDGLIVPGGASGSSEGAHAPTEDQLLDVLYEVLAQGIPPRSRLSREEIERFLHQHARERKPLGEMLAFFERHGLPLDAGEYGADRELRELASGLQRERSAQTLGFGPSHELVLPTAPLPEAPPLMAAPGHVSPVEATATLSAHVVPDGETTGQHVLMQTLGTPPSLRSRAEEQRGSSSPSRLRWLALAAAVLALALLGSVFVVNQQRASELEQRLDQARMQQRSTDDALTKLEQRAQTLQGALEQSEETHRQESTRLETTLEAEKQERATEEMAVERMLGPRYLKLRQKLTTEAAQTVPGIIPTGSASPSPSRP